MILGNLKDVNACENRRLLFFTVSTFAIVLKYLSKFGEEAERERQLLSPLYDAEQSSSRADADDVRRIGGIWMFFNDQILPERCLSSIFPELLLYTYKVIDYEKTSFSSCLFIPISRPATASEYDELIKILISKIESQILFKLACHSAMPNGGHDIPVRKPLASDWFPLPYKFKSSSRKSYRFFEGKGRNTLDVDCWTGDHNRSVQA